MRSRLVLAVLAVLALSSLAGWARAQAPSDIIDAVFLGETRPVLFRFHVTVDGQPFHVAWNDFVYDLFRYLDRDGDLVLSKSEIARMPSQTQLYQFRLGSFLNLGGNSALMNEVDVNNDGKVTLDELAGYFQRSPYTGAVMLMPNSNVASSNALTQTIFRCLDANNDGKLTQEEASLAAEVLRTFDLDDDEMVTLAELSQNPNTPYYVVQQPQIGGAMQQTPFLLHGRGQFTARLVPTLVSKYDKNQNFKLSREEIRLDKAVFDRLDTDKDGQLMDSELVEFFGMPPEVDVVFRLGNTKEAIAEVFRSPQRILSLSSMVKSAAPGVLTVHLDDGRMELRTGNAQGVYVQPIANLRQTYLQQFKLADADKNGYLDQKELQAPQFRYFATLLPFVDRDDDKRISEKELIGYFDLQDKASRGAVVLTVTDSGRELFPTMDANRDNRLGVRELRTLWSRLASLDRDGDGCISRTEIPRQFQVNVTQGQSNNYNQRLVAVQGFGMGIGQVTPPGRGPLWFRKMDRNADGDVSYREFLGTKQEFRRLDADGDGLIDAKEAERAGLTVARAISPGAFRTR